MSIASRSVAVAALLLGAISCWSSAAAAADWPRRTVRLIAPVPAGAGSDFTARLFAERLSQRWGQPVIVENRPGADGVIGVSAFLSTEDDHTLLYAISAVVTVHPITQQKLPYDPVRELVPISPTSDVTLAIAASEKNSIRSLDDLVRTARAQPGKLNWAGSPGLPPFVVGGFFKNSKLDLAVVGDLLQIPMDFWQAGYQKDQEFEADREGMYLAVKAGYSPYGTVGIFMRFSKLYGEQTVQASDPADELSQLARESLAGYFRSHPLSSERLAQANRIISQEHWENRKEQRNFRVEYQVHNGQYVK